MNNSPTDFVLTKLCNTCLKCQRSGLCRGSAVLTIAMALQTGVRVSGRYAFWNQLQYFNPKLDCFLLDKSEADFPILFPRWICTREYPGRATPLCKLSFGAICKVHIRFRGGLFFFFFQESICTRECPLELSFGNSPGQISICNDLVSLRKTLKDFPRFSPECICTKKDFVNVARFAYLAKVLNIYRGTSLIRNSAPPRTLR